jgi:uncharacterized protein YifE (UPF0438 family)/ribosomal protein L24E
MMPYEDKLTDSERELLDHHLRLYEALDSGWHQPTTDDQRHFVEVCRGRAEACTQHEFAYLKYRVQKSHVPHTDSQSGRNDVQSKSRHHPWKPPHNWRNKYPGFCIRCHKWVEPGEGTVFQEGSSWEVVHFVHNGECILEVRPDGTVVYPTMWAKGARRLTRRGAKHNKLKR